MGGPASFPCPAFRQAPKNNKLKKGHASGPKTPSSSSPSAKLGNTTAKRVPHERRRPSAHPDTGAEAAATHEAALASRSGRSTPNNARDTRAAKALRSKGFGGRGARNETLLTSQLRDLSARVAGNHDAEREIACDAAEALGAAPPSVRSSVPLAPDLHECSPTCPCPEAQNRLREVFAETTDLMELRSRRAQLLLGAYQHVVPPEFRRSERSMFWAVSYCVQHLCAVFGLNPRSVSRSKAPVPPSSSSHSVASMVARLEIDAEFQRCLKRGRQLGMPLSLSPRGVIIITGGDFELSASLYMAFGNTLRFDAEPAAPELRPDALHLRRTYPHAIARRSTRAVAVLDVTGLWDPAAKAHLRDLGRYYRATPYALGPSRGLLSSTNNPKPSRHALDGAIGPEILVNTTGAASTGAWSWAFADQKPRHVWMPLVRPEDDSYAPPVLVATLPGGVLELASVTGAARVHYPRRTPEQAANSVASWLQGGFLFHTSVRNTVAGAAGVVFNTFGGATAHDVALTAGHTTVRLAAAVWQVAYLWGMLRWLTSGTVATLISIDRNPAAPSVWEALQQRFWWKRNMWWVIPCCVTALGLVALDFFAGSNLATSIYYLWRSAARSFSFWKLLQLAWAVFASPTAILGALASLTAFLSQLDRRTALRLLFRLALACALVYAVMSIPGAYAVEPGSGEDAVIRALSLPERAFGPPIWQTITFLYFWLYIHENFIATTSSLMTRGMFVSFFVATLGSSFLATVRLLHLTHRRFRPLFDFCFGVVTRRLPGVSERYHQWVAMGAWVDRDTIGWMRFVAGYAPYLTCLLVAIMIPAIYEVADRDGVAVIMWLCYDIVYSIRNAVESAFIVVAMAFYFFEFRYTIFDSWRPYWVVLLLFVLSTHYVDGAQASEATYQEDRWSSDNPLNYVIGVAAGIVAPLAGLRVGQFLQAPQAVCPAGCVRDLPPTRKVKITVTDRRGSVVIENEGPPSKKLQKLWKRICAEPCKPEQAFTPLGPIGPGILTYRQCRHGEFLAALSRVFIPREPVDPESAWFKRARAATRRFAQLCILNAVATERWWPVNEAPQYLTKGGRYWADFTRLANPWREGRPGFRGFTKAETSAKCVVAASPGLEVPKLRPRLISNPDPSSLPQIMTTMSSVMSICKDSVPLWNERELIGTEYSVTWGVGKSAKGLSAWFEQMLRTASKGVIVGGDDSCYVDCAAASPRAINGDGSNFDATVSSAWKTMIIEEVYEPILRHHPDQVMAAHVLAILWENAKTANITLGGKRGETRINFRGEGCRNSGEVDTTFGNTFLLNLAYLEAFHRGALTELTLTKVYEDFGFIPEIAEVPIERAEFFSCLIVPVEEFRDGSWEPTYVWSPLIGRQIVKFMAKYGAVRACDVQKQRELRQFAMWLLAPATPVLRGMAFNHSDKFTEFDLSQLDAFRSGILHPHPWLIRPTDVTYLHFANRYECTVEELRHLEAFVRTNHDRPIVYTCQLLERIFRVDMGHDLVMPPFRDANEIALQNTA